MTEIVEVQASDQDAIVKFLLKELGGKEEPYRRLFRYSELFETHDGVRPPLGSCVKDANGEILGFLGCLCHFSTQYGGRWVVNMSSWVVHPKARSSSLKLLQHFLSDRSKIYTNFSATPSVQRILPRFGFIEIDDKELRYSAYPFMLSGWMRGLRTKVGNAAVARFAGTEKEKVLSDHLALGCIVLSPTPKSAYVFLKRNYGRAHALQLIHFFNLNSDQLSKDWGALCFASVFKCRATRLIIDSRYAPESKKNIEVKDRRMFVRGVQDGEPIPTRAYSEPIQDFGRF